MFDRRYILPGLLILIFLIVAVFPGIFPFGPGNETDS